MTQINMLTSQEAVVQLSAADDATPPNSQPASFSAVTAPFPAGYTAVVGGNQLHFVPSATGTYTVIITGTSSNGTALATTTINITVTDTGAPGQATHFVLGDVTLRTKDIITPSNPGSDTVTGSV